MSRYGIVIRDDGHRYERMYDPNGIIGYDEAEDTWFIMGFERDYDDCPELWLGDGICEIYPCLYNLFDKIETMNISICISENVRKKILKDMGKYGDDIIFDSYSCIVDIPEDEYMAYTPQAEESHIMYLYNLLSIITPDLKDAVDRSLYELKDVLLNGNIEYDNYDTMRIFLTEIFEMKNPHAVHQLLYKIIDETERKHAHENHSTYTDFASGNDEIPF